MHEQRGSVDNMRRTNIIYEKRSFRFQVVDCHCYGLHCYNLVRLLNVVFWVIKDFQMELGKAETLIEYESIMPAR